MSPDPMPTSPPEFENPAGRRRAVALLGLTLVFGMSTWFSASAVIPQLRSLWNLSDPAGAWLTIAVQLGFVGGALLSSAVNLADLVSLRKIILSSVQWALLQQTPAC